MPIGLDLRVYFDQILINSFVVSCLPFFMMTPTPTPANHQFPLLSSLFDWYERVYFPLLLLKQWSQLLKTFLTTLAIFIYNSKIKISKRQENNLYFFSLLNVDLCWPLGFYAHNWGEKFLCASFSIRSTFPIWWLAIWIFTAATKTKN